MRYFFLLVLLLWVRTLPSSAGEHFLDCTEHDVLNTFFRTLVEKSEVGYVIEGKKPVCVHALFSSDPFLVDTPIHRESVAIKEGARVWAGFHPASKDLRIGISDKEDPEIPGCRHLIATNLPLLQKTVEQHLPLFQYVLGPMVTAESICEAITSSQTTFHSLLKGDKVLIGIVLGFGLRNSLYVSRLENIEEMLHECIPPFIMQQGECQYEGNRFFPIFPSYSFKSIDQEVEKLGKSVALSSEKLCEEEPIFLFGSLNESEDLKHIERLEKAQLQIQKFLQREDFLTAVLSQFGITKGPSQDAKAMLELREDDEIELILATGIWEMLRAFDPIARKEFIHHFGRRGTPVPDIPSRAFSPEYFQQILSMSANNAQSERFFCELAKSNRYKEIIPEKLYQSTTTSLDSGEAFRGPLATFDCSVYSMDGHCQSMFHAKQIHLGDTIPGFSAGVLGMKQGETREIFVHPTLAYGNEESSTMCLPLRIVTTLKCIHDNSGYQPRTTTVEIDYLVDSKWVNDRRRECLMAVAARAATITSHLSKNPSIDLNRIGEYLKQIYDGNMVFVSPSEREQTIINRVHWNIYFQSPISTEQKRPK